MEIKKASSTFEVTDLLKTIMMNFQNIQIIKSSKIGSLVEKEVSFLIFTLR